MVAMTPCAHEMRGISALMHAGYWRFIRTSASRLPVECALRGDALGDPRTAVGQPINDADLEAFRQSRR